MLYDNMWLRASFGSESRLMFFVFDVLQLVSTLLALVPHLRCFGVEGFVDDMLICIVLYYQLVFVSFITAMRIPTTNYTKPLVFFLILKCRFFADGDAIANNIAGDILDRYVDI